jgi:hypothetical protein
LKLHCIGLWLALEKTLILQINVFVNLSRLLILTFRIFCYFSVWPKWVFLWNSLSQRLMKDNL